MKSLLTLLLFFTMALCADQVKAQGPIPNITDSRLDFSVTGLKGETIQLSSFKGKVFLLDFWASWCRPCRFTNKDLVKLYGKYKDKGLEIVSISLDDEQSAWKKAVSKDKMSWINGYDAGGWDAKAPIKWQVDALPSSFLVNKDGDVVAINLDKDELEKKIKELLGL